MAKKKRSYDTPPPAPAAATENAPLGVAADYVYEDLDSLGQVRRSIRPRYFPGAQRTEVAGLSPEDRATLQLRMRDLGLIGPETKITLGVWDTTSANAFADVLRWANTTGRDWREALEDLELQASTLPQIPDPGQEPGKRTSGLDIEALGRRTGLEVLGKTLDDQQQAAFESRFRGMEAPYLSPDGTTAAPTSAGVEEWSRQQVRALDPVRADSRSAVKVAGVISRMLGGATAFEGGQ